MKQLQLILVLAFLTIKLAVTAQTKLPECNTGVPHFNIDLSTNPDSMYITPNVVRTEQCCGSPNSNDNYVSFYVKAHPDVAMIEVDIYSGANPPGDAAKYNVITGGDAFTPGICGPDINAGSPTCVTLDPSGYLKVTYYKPGSNKNQYYFKQIPKPIYPNDDTTRAGCSLPLNIYGLDNISITSINSSTGNTTLGAYNSLLSCTNCSEPIFSPGLSTPAWIDYQICGSPQAAACGTYASCDTVRLYTFGELALSVNPNPASFCSGGGGVTLTATATGGDGNYTFKWKDSFGVVVSTSNVYNANSAGTFTAEVTDGLTTVLCPAEYVSVPVTIGNPPVVNAGLDQTLCATNPAALLSGSIQYATGGIWTGGNGTFSPVADSLLTVYTPTAAEISSGSVTLTLTSTGAGGGCVNDSDKVIITFSDTIFVNPSAAPIVCNGDVTTISANATGGTAPLTYVWSSGATSSSISASAGTYSVMVRDAVGCVSSSSITVIDPAPMTLTLSSTNVSTDPSCDGSASVVISGGVAPYSVLWSNSETTLTTSNTLCYGITTVTVTDANGCVVTGSVVVNNPSCSSFNVTATSTDVDCYGGTNGIATVFPVGGTPTYTYLWNSTPNQTTQSASNLPAGNYTVTVTDDLGCVDVAGVTISQPTVITNTITHTDVTTIGGSDGSATANPQGGTPNYSYLWTPGGQTTQTASNLSSAVGGLTYYLTITDDNSCTYNDSVLVNQPPCNNFILSVNTTDVTCNGLSNASAYIVIAHGTPPYNIVWSHGPTNVTSVTGLSSGIYSVTVTDASNCTTFQNFTITEPAPLSLSLVPTNVVCNGDKNGTIDLSVAGGTFPYKYTWKLGTTTIANHEDLVNLAPGTYSVTVTDDNKCTVTGSVGITQPNKLDATAIVVDNICYGTTNASIDMTPTGGMLPYNYTWTGPSGFTSSSEDISNLNVGLYEFSFTDGNGCQSPTYQSYINEPDTVLIGNIEVPCPTPGASTVTVNVDSIIGGNGGPYQISFDNQVTYQPTGVYTYSLNVGATYQVWARDTNGCTSISPYILTVDTNVAVSSVNFNSCIPFGATTIPVTVNPIGGNGGPYQVSTDGGTTWTTVGTYVVNLAVNTSHNVIARDTNNCVSTNYTFYIPAEISSSITMTSEVSCLGFNDGALDLTVSGGVPNYNFAWTGPSGFTSTNEDLSGLFAGMYYVTITDDEGCTKLDSIEITTVLDTINPIITCVGNQTVNTSSTTCDYTVSGIAWDAVATDNCVVSNLSYSLTGATTGTGNTLNNVAFNLGTTTVTWTATDSLGNTAQCTYTITVIDNIDPSIVACGAGNQTVNVDAGQCSFTQTANVWDATATDNCTVSTITADLSGATTATGLTTLNGVSFNTGVTTVLWTVTDSVGNSVTCTYTITVIDNIDPSIVACGAGNQTVNVDAGQCYFTQTANVWDATATDNCTVSTITADLSGATTATGLTTLNGVSFNTGVTTVLWTVTDTVGNSVTCTYTITVIDNIDPSIVACGAGNQTVNVDAGQCSFTQTANVWDATATDNCTVSTITADLSGATTATGLTTLNGVSFNTGVTTVLWTVTDTVGNSVTCTYTITVIDNIDPSIVACGAGNQTVNVDAGQCSFTQTANVWDATATDNCTVSTITADLSGATTATGLTTLNGVSFNTGVTTVLWTVTDSVGNSVTCTYTITVIDNIDPSIVACGAGNQTVNVDAGQCSFTQTANVWDATATDNCTVSTITADLSGATTATGLTTLNGVSFNTGVTTVLWTVTDTVGNSVTCTYTITVIDNIDPSIVACGAGNQTVNVDAGQCSFTQTANVWDATATDNCTVSTITADLSGATTATGLTTLNGVSFNTGVTTVLWTVTDTVGNSVTCTYTITVIDNIDPSIVACGAGNQTVNVDAGQCSFTQTANVWDATATDNCTVSTITADLSGATTATGLTTLNGVSFNTGVTTVLWTVTDTVGNSVTCTYTITVIDNIDPSILACGAGNQTVNVDAGQCSFTQTANVWDATATDNCTVSTITADLSGATTATGLTTLNGVSFNTGVTTILWTVTDTVGNSVTCTYTITVIDNIDPSIIACGAGNQVMAADSGVCTYTHLDNTWDATATDNCTVDSIYYTLSGATSGTGTTLNGVTFNNGITMVLWTVTDTVGNTVTCSFSVDVLDTEAPIISNCPTDITVGNDSSVCGAVVTWTPPTFTDNCGATMTSTHNPGDSFVVGTTVVTYTVTDSAGNVSTCAFNVIVNDTELPIITCSPQIASCDSLVNFNAPTATDNCGILSVTQIAGLPSGSIFPVGTTTNTFEVIDIHNNVAQCSFDVVIHPTPIISSVSTDVSCFGLNDGSIDITVTNGTTPYTYTWSNSAITEDVANLAPGIYSVTVTDSNSCMATAQDTISEPALLTIVATDSNVTCYGGSNGAIDVTVAGGIAPYTYLWNTNDTIADLSNLSVGYYEVTVTDSNGCTVSYSTTITSPDSIAIQTTANNATCLGANGSIQTQVTGGVMPYSYAWSNGDTTLNLSNVTAGVYTLVVTDANGCTAQITDTVNSVSNLVVELATEDVSCYGKADGEIRVVTTSGNPPYSYSWSTGDSTSVASGLDVGGYYVIVTDSFGCQDSLFATIYQPDSLVVELDAYMYPSGTNISLYGGEDGSIVSMVFGGTSPYEYLWSTGDTTADISDLKAGEYSLIVTDENGCIGFAKIILTQPNVLEMPNGYSPNGDGSNDFFVIKGVEAYPDNEIVVFNRWGNIVYEGKNYNNEWKGDNKSGEDLPDGTYFVIFKVLSPEEITLQGYVDLRRK